MVVGKVCGGSNMALLLPNDKLPCSSSDNLLDPLWIPNSSPNFHGAKSMVNFENVCGGNTTDRPFFQQLGKDENCDEDYDGCFHQPVKKRRLTMDQVQFLEKNFEFENKLEPERKIQLAKELGLQPRQVAIWFQNRRARFKTKQLEKDYDRLEASYKTLQAEYENLLKETEKLKEEVMSLKNKLNIRYEDLEQVKAIETDKTLTPNAVSEHVWNVSSSDSDSPHYTEPADSSNVFEFQHSSDISQDEEDNLSKNLLQPSYMLKLEDECYPHLPPTSCHYGLSLEDQPFCFWPY